MQNFLPAALSKLQLEQRIGDGSIEAEPRHLYHARAYEVIAAFQAAPGALLSDRAFSARRRPCRNEPGECAERVLRKCASRDACRVRVRPLGRQRAVAEAGVGWFLRLCYRDGGFLSRTAFSIVAALTRIWSRTHTYSVSGEDAAPGEFTVFELCVGGTTCTVLTRF